MCDGCVTLVQTPTLPLVPLFATFPTVADAAVHESCRQRPQAQVRRRRTTNSPSRGPLANDLFGWFSIATRSRRNTRPGTMTGAPAGFRCNIWVHVIDQRRISGVLEISGTRGVLWDSTNKKYTVSQCASSINRSHQRRITEGTVKDPPHAFNWGTADDWKQGA